MDKVVCYYHANCFDGMGAAWVVKQKYPEADLIPVSYGNKGMEQSIMQDCFENANINYHYIIVDFSFPRDLMVAMSDKAKSIVVLDHHKTAMANCEGLDFCVFDMEQSGAGLAWRHFNPLEPMPVFIQFIEDRDLWKFSLPYSEEFNAFIQSFEMTVENYDLLHDMLDAPEGHSVAITGGMAINRYKKSMVEAMCKNAVFRDVGRFMVPTVNATLLFSEIGHRLCQMYPEAKFAASYFIRSDNKIQYSLRSIGEFDVSEIARLYGGGGHKNAAGFERGLVAMI